MSIKVAHARALVNRAESHMREFEHKSNTFNDRNPHTTFIDVKSEPAVRLYKIAITADIPIEIACITFDIVNALRSSLDYAVFEATQIITGVSNPKDTKFPFGNPEDGAVGRFKKQVQSIPDDFKDFLLAFEPYEAGNRTLWGLNKIRNEKIHCLLRGTAVARSRFQIFEMKDSGVFDFISEWDPDNRELTVGRQIGGQRVNVKFSHDIAFEEATPFGGMLAIKVFDDILGIVNSVIMGIEAETARIKS